MYTYNRMTSADVKCRFTPEKYAEYKQKSKEWVLNKYHTDEEYKNLQIENKLLLRMKKRDAHYLKWDTDKSYRIGCQTLGMRDRRPKFKI